MNIQGNRMADHHIRHLLRGGLTGLQAANELSGTENINAV